MDMHRPCVHKGSNGMPSALPAPNQEIQEDMPSCRPCLPTSIACVGGSVLSCACYLWGRGIRRYSCLWEGLIAIASVASSHKSQQALAGIKADTRLRLDELAGRCRA